ncbi:MAG: hypothetical protein AB7O78_09960 [Thermoleophilia bacterium]
MQVNARGFITGTNYPAGEYVMQANLILANSSNAAVTVTCELLAGADTADTAEAVLAAAGGVDTATLAMAGPGDGTLTANLGTLVCSADGAGVTFEDADMLLTRVGSLDDLSPLAPPQTKRLRTQTLR